MEGIFLLAIVLLSPSFIASAQATGEYYGDLSHGLASMCTQSSNTIFLRMEDNRGGIFSTWISEMRSYPIEERLSHYFHSKPVNTPRNSICQPMNTTCCKPISEKHLVKAAQKEYGELFLDVTQEAVGACFTVGRNFHHVMYSQFAEIRRQLEIPLNTLLEGKLDIHLLDSFFSYLNSFPITSDLCDLPLYLESVMNDIFDFVYGGQQGRDTHPECYRNVSTQIMETTYEELFVKLERQLYNLDLIYRAMFISEEVLESIKRHRLSPECTKPLTQLQNCGQCTGYYKFKPCLFYCMNVFRGCFADVADIHQEFALLTRALSDIPDDILGTFQPEVFISNSLAYLVDLVEALNERDLKADVFDACMDSGGARQKRKFLHRRQSPSNLAAVTPTVRQEEDRLMAAFNQELGCMEDIGALLGNAPELMCYLSKDYSTIADTGNHRCWTGSRMGTYWHSQVRFTKEDQAHNPEFHGRAPPYLNQYDDLCMDISLITAEINMTLDLVLCLDDADCLGAPFYVCESEMDDELPAAVASSGSGSEIGASGSGSGSGGYNIMDDGMRDMEDGDSPQIDDELEDVPDIHASTSNTVVKPSDVIEEEGYTVWDSDSGLSTTVPSEPSVSTATRDHTTNQPTPTPPPPVIIDVVPVAAAPPRFIGGGSSRTQLDGKLFLLATATLLLLALA